MLNKISDLYLHAFHKSFDYSQVDEHVYIGTNMCCQLGFDEQLLSKGVMADISLEEAKVDAPSGIKFFLWLPTVDHEAPSLDQMQLGVQTIKFLLSKKIPVFLHCKNGHGRAPTLYAAYLVSKGMSVNEAIAAIKAKRQAIHLYEAQRAALEVFAKVLKKINL